MPSPGRISYFHPPGGLGVRVDSAAYQGYVIPPYYDSLIGKLIVHGRNRTEALMRLRRALDEFVVDGVETTLPLYRTLVRNLDMQNGQYDIHWLEGFLESATKRRRDALKAACCYFGLSSLTPTAAPSRHATSACPILLRVSSCSSKLSGRSTPVTDITLAPPSETSSTTQS